MGPLQRTLATLLLLIACLSCGGGTFFIGVDHGVTVLMTSGTVQFVNFTITNGNTQITVVTLLDNGVSQTFNFCGNLVNQFPLNSFVNVNFTRGMPCSGVVQVTVTSS